MAETVYILWHVHSIAEDHDDEKLIGVYSTQAEPEAAQQRIQDKAGISR